MDDLPACIRTIVFERLQDLGLESVRLALGASETQNHTRILVSSDLAKKKRLIVLLPERSKELGIFSFRTIGGEGINKGSAVDFTSAVLKFDTGIIIANPGQLLWYRGGGRAVSRTEWSNLPRESAVHEPFR